MTDSTLQAIELARRIVGGEVFVMDIRVIETDFIRALVELAGGRPNKIDVLRVERGDWFRAAGDAECSGWHHPDGNRAAGGISCGRPYRDHPSVPGFEWLHRLCDGRLVKL